MVKDEMKATLHAGEVVIPIKAIDKLIESIQQMDMLYECSSCGHKEIAKAQDKKKDGRACSECKKHTVPICYIGIDMANKTDS